MIKTFYISFIFSLILFSVNCCQNKGFKPDRDNDSVDYNRKREIENKRVNFKLKNLTNKELYILSDSLGTTKISVFIPQTDEIGLTETKIIESKLIQILTLNGIGGIGGNPRFILTPVITQTKQDITSTAPTMYSNTYDVTLYIADALNGDIFASTSIAIPGVGQSPLKAFLNAFDNLKPSEKQFFDFVSKGRAAITNYYNANCANILKEAEKLVGQKQFNSALTLLDAIPTNVNCYDKVVEKSTIVFQKLIDNDCEIVLSKMKAEFGKSNDQTASGFNESAMNYYSMINPSSKCFKETETIYSEYLKNLNPKAKRDWEQSMREYNDKLADKKQEWEFKKQEAEIKAEMSIKGNNELLEIYRKQYNYEKLPWIRKWIHLGNNDPFDGTK